MSRERQSLSALISECGGLFTVDRARELAASVGIGETYLAVLLRAWVDSGLLWRVKRGLYVVTARAEGLTPPHPFIIGNALATPSAVSGLAALHFHGIVAEPPATIDVTTVQRIPTPVPARGRFRLVSVPLAGFVGMERHVFGQHEAWVFSIERALIDVFVSPRRFGGSCEAMALFEDALGRFDPERLLGLAQRWGSQTNGRIRAALREFAGNRAAGLRPPASGPEPEARGPRPEA